MIKIQIEAPFSVNDYLEEVIQKHVNKLGTYQKNILHADVFLKLKDATPPNDKLVEIRLRRPGPELFAEGKAETFEKAVAACAEKLRRQLVSSKRR